LRGSLVLLVGLALGVVDARGSSADLDARGEPPDRVRLVPSLEDFIKDNVPSAEELALAQQRFDADADWREELSDKVYNALNALELEWPDRLTVVATESADIDEVAVDDVAVETIAIVDAYETDEGDIVSIEIRVDATLWFTFTTDIMTVTEHELPRRYGAELNAAQLEVLRWVADGCPDGIYEGYSHGDPRRRSRCLTRHKAPRSDTSPS
jgi:hypothetical protein